MKRARQSGIALFYVLVVTAVVSLLALQFTLEARRQVAAAQAVLARAQAALDLRSAESDVLLALATQPLAAAPSGPDPVARRWNFYGEPFDHGGVAVSIQDLNGLLYLPFAAATGALPPLLESLGVPEPQAGQMNAAILAAAQGAPPRPIQLYDELSALPGFTPRLAPYVTLYPHEYFNPLAAPEPVLRVTVGAGVAGNLARARERSDIPAWELTTRAGLVENDSMRLLPGPGFLLRFEKRVGSVRPATARIAVVRPTAKNPFEFWNTGVPERFQFPPPSAAGPAAVALSSPGS